MRKHILIIACSFFFSPFILIAQSNDLTLDKLKAPSMPSATIIGTQVNDITRPKSLKDLETAVFSNFLAKDQGLTIPDNYAIEFNPYMLSGRKNFNYNEYLTDDAGKNIVHNFSISVASTGQYIINDSLSSKAMGFGIRTIIFNGMPSNKIKEAFTSYFAADTSQLDLKNEIRSYIDFYVNSDTVKDKSPSGILACVMKELEKNNAPAPDKNSVKSVFGKIKTDTPPGSIENAFIEIFNKDILNDALNKVQTVLDTVKNFRYGLRWEIDAAFALGFPDNNFGNSIVPRWGMWTNISYQPEGMDDFTFIALGRIMLNNEKFINKYSPSGENYNSGNIYDFGGRLVYKSDKFSLEFEYIYRINSSKIIKIIDGEEYSRNVDDNTGKYIINANYNITDDIVLSFNFGKNYDNIAGANGNLISGLSINFGFGDIKAGDLLKKPE